MEKHPFIPERLEEWAYWIVEREAIRKRRERGQGGAPYHDDPVLAYTRWCNVRRMDDKVSKWLMENWYPAVSLNARDLVVSALLARMINRPETLSYVTQGNPYSGWNYTRYRNRMYEIKDRGDPVFTNAYIINGASGGPKIEQVLGAIDACYGAKPFPYLVPTSMQQTAHALCKLRGVGSFIAGQVVADLRWLYHPDDPDFWGDCMDWAPPGPGSSKGMKYLLGLATPADMAGRGKDMGESQFLRYLPILVRVAQQYPGVSKVFRDRKLEAHDIQNTLCELSKYVRVKHGGHAKNSYPPKRK